DREQTLLRRLGIFVGGFQLDAAETVCAADEPDVLPSADAVYLTLAELVSKSLVVFDQGRARYRLLEPIRLFARELLEQSSECALVAARHSRWVLHWSRGALLTLTTAARGTDATGLELANAHTALEWLHATGDHETYLRIVAALGFPWYQTDWRRGRAITE